MIDQLVAAGFSVKQCCRVLGVSSAGYYMYRKRPLSPTKMRREWLTALIKEVHAESHARVIRKLGAEPVAKIETPAIASTKAVITAASGRYIRCSTII